MSNRREQQASTDLGSSLGASTAQAIDQMIRWPFWFTGATMDLMLQGMERMTGQTNRTMGTDGPNGGGMGTHGGGSAGMSAGASGSGSNWSAGMNVGTSAGKNQGQSQSQGSASTGDDQDLSGDDLKYVLWSILFCKPGYETVLEPLQADIVAYNADGASYAAVKIAKYLEKARNGRTERPQLWAEKEYPQGSSASRRSEPANIVGGNQSASGSNNERGWRIPAEDHKYIKFVYRVERRLPKEEPEVTRVERVTIERGTETTRHSSVA
jgi:hypothetical protein